ncbi:MAG: methionyl-tRNA formyltransferase [Spirochaetes bacterium]|nr:MAG: methionyl-tRNA formyltransferase [Spirochaetota bacterium]
MKNIRIAFFGTAGLSKSVLEALYNEKYNISLVITKPDKIRGRGKKLLPTSVKQFALEHNIPVVALEKVNPDFIDLLKEYRIDISLVVAFGQILPAEVIDYPQYGSLNLHASLLPQLRGASPIQSAILFGLKRTGITLQKMKFKMDAGDILAQEEIAILENWGAEDLLKVVIETSPTFVIKKIPLYLEGKLTPIPQDDSKATYCYSLKKSDGLIDWNTDAVRIVRKILAFNTWPVCYTYLKGNILRLFKATVYSNLSKEIDMLKPGEIFDVDKKIGILVKVKGGAVAIQELQLQNKKRMNFIDFVNGYRNIRGIILGK